MRRSIRTKIEVTPAHKCEVDTENTV